MYKIPLNNVLHDKFLEVVTLRLEVTLPMCLIRARQDLRPKGCLHESWWWDTQRMWIFLCIVKF